VPDGLNRIGKYQTQMAISLAKSKQVTVRRAG
jgi:hypothetical protein